MNPELPAGYAAYSESETVFRLSWYERLRVVFGRPIRVRERTAFLYDPRERNVILTLDITPIGGQLPD